VAVRSATCGCLWADRGRDPFSLHAVRRLRGDGPGDLSKCGAGERFGGVMEPGSSREWPLSTVWRDRGSGQAQPRRGLLRRESFTDGGASATPGTGLEGSPHSAGILTEIRCAAPEPRSARRCRRSRRIVAGCPTRSGDPAAKLKAFRDLTMLASRGQATAFLHKHGTPSGSRCFAQGPGGAEEPPTERTSDSGEDGRRRCRRRQAP